MNSFNRILLCDKIFKQQNMYHINYVHKVYNSIIILKSEILYLPPMKSFIFSYVDLVYSNITTFTIKRTISSSTKPLLIE